MKETKSMATLKTKHREIKVEDKLCIESSSFKHFWPMRNAELICNNIPVIGKYGFISPENRTRLGKVTLINTEIISESAFVGQTIKTLEIKSNIALNVNTGAFAYNSDLESVELRGKHIRIGTNAFQGCYNLKKVEIVAEDSLIIGENAFDGCSSMTRIEVKYDKILFQNSQQTFSSKAPIKYLDVSNFSDFVHINFNTENFSPELKLLFEAGKI